MLARIYDRALVVSNICEDIISGMSLRAACALPGRPGKLTFLRWLDDNTEEALDWRNQYARAREVQAEHFADEIIEIADTEKDWGIARNRIDARKWAASKLAPKKYGDRVVHAGDDNAPVQIVERIELVPVKPKTRDE